jgi:hypothetical protein
VYAWGPATHAVIAMEATGDSSPAIIYGAMMPDMNGLLNSSPLLSSRLKRLTHFEWERLAPSTFARGFATHNGVWGADYFAHLYYKEDAELIYSTRIIHQLRDEFGVTAYQAEDIFEGVVEYRVRLDHGPELGELLGQAIDALDKGEEDALVAAFLEPLNETVSDMDSDAVESKLRWAVHAFKSGSKLYANLLKMDEAYLQKTAVNLMATQLSCDMETAEAYINRGMELTTDYKIELTRIADVIREKLAKAEKETENHEQ